MKRRKVTATELKNHLGAYLEAAIAALSLSRSQGVR